jgi:hypothetical protein
MERDEKMDSYQCTPVVATRNRLFEVHAKRRKSVGKAQKFNLNASSKYVIVVNEEVPSQTAMVLAAPIQRRNYRKIIKYHSHSRWSEHAMAPSQGYPMAPHSRIRIVKRRPAKFRWLLGWIAAMLCLSTLLPAIAQAQVTLPVVIKLPPSFLQSSPTEATSAKVEPLRAGVVREMVDIPATSSAIGPQIAALRNAEVRATELRGLLPHQHDNHYFGLEALEPGGGLAVTMVVEPASVLEDNAVNFVVLTSAGMKQVLKGVDPLAVKTAMGSPLLFDQIGNRLTALVPGNRSGDYTVIVYNNSKLPATYTLQVQGGVLIDDAGQSFSSIKVSAPSAENFVERLTRDAARAQEVAAEYAHEGVVKRYSIGLAKEIQLSSTLSKLLPEAVRARRVSGMLMSAQDRHYLNLATDTGGGDVTLTLRYQGMGAAPSRLNFWVMTQDGVRQLVQGGLAQELNLATGLVVSGEKGLYQARLRMAENMLYTVVVFNESGIEADYTLSVQGGILVDRYGQTREAHAAEQELLALAGN